MMKNENVIEDFENWAINKCLDISKLPDTTVPIYISCSTFVAFSAWLAAKEKYETKNNS